MIEQRVSYYDLIKVVAIYLVCLYHYGLNNYDVSITPGYSSYLRYFIAGITSAGVPLFLMVNGALLLNKNYDLKKHLLKTGAITLLMLLWSVLSMLLTEPLYEGSYTFSELIDYAWALGRKENNHLWFLHALVYIYLLFPLIKALYDSPKKEHTVYLVVLIFIFTFGDVALENMLHVGSYLLNIDRFLYSKVYIGGWINPFFKPFSYALLYFILGGLISKNLQRFSFKNSHLYLVLFISLALLFMLGLVETQIRGELYDTVWNGYNTIMTLAMTVVIFILCSKVRITGQNTNNAIHLIGINTLGIYFVHVPLGEWLSIYYTRFTLSNFLVTDVLYALFLMLLAFIITLFIKKIPVIRKSVQL